MDALRAFVGQIGAVEGVTIEGDVRCAELLLYELEHRDTGCWPLLTDSTRAAYEAASCPARYFIADGLMSLTSGGAVVKAVGHVVRSDGVTECILEVVVHTPLPLQMLKLHAPPSCRPQLEARRPHPCP